MIKSLSISNFQSHEKSKLEFSPGVNIIVGSSDSGKTAIIRAMRWVSWNRPSGDAIRSTWGGETFVILETEEGYVLRFKDKTDKYELKRNGKGSLVFKAFGTNVPEEIIAFLNINEINLQQQLDTPFLLSESPGVVAQHFNKVARLDKIDSGLQNVQGEIRQLTSDIKYKEQYVEEQTEELKIYNYLEKAEIKLEVLEELEKRRVVLKNNINKLQTKIDTLYDIHMSIESESAILIYDQPVNNLLSLIERRAQQDIEDVKLDRLMTNIKEVKEQILQSGLICVHEKTVNKLLLLYNNRKTVVQDQNSLSKLLSNLANINGRADSAKALQTSLEAQFKREFPETCPLCGKPK
jgi:exonuclease SbcC